MILLNFLKSSSTRRKHAKLLDANDPKHIKEVVDIIQSGGVVAFPFNGIYGLFGNADNIQAAEKIAKAKNRPKDKSLILVSAPEYLHEHVQMQKIEHHPKKLINLWKDVHALGIILPAAATAPYHLVVRGEIDTILNIWTEYKPMRMLIEQFRKRGGRALVGTSANKNGQPTHYSIDTLWEDFGEELDAVVVADFRHLRKIRRKSTTVIDLTEKQPRLHRLGNLTEKELREAISRHDFPKLTKQRDLILVRGRE